MNRPEQYSLQLSLDNFQTDAQHKKFFEVLSSIDELTIAQATNNVDLWFQGKGLVPEVVKYNYRPLVKTTAKFPPLVKLKVPVNQAGQPMIDVYRETDGDLEQVGIEALTRNSRVVAITELRSVWFVASNYGLTLRVAQLKIVDQAAGLSGPAFI